MFDLIQHIDPIRPETYEGKHFLSLDIDWAHDEVLADAIDIVEHANVAATWFVTHDTPLLARLRGNPKFALGIHPNFNELLNGSDKAGKDASSIFTAIMALVPEAKVVRSHSLVQSERLVDLFHQHGLTHISNFYIPESTAPLKPWVLWDGIICTPHGWQDNVSMRLHGNLRMPETGNGLRIYDFHPIHVFLNSENVARYESARADFRNPSTLIAHRGSPFGSRSALIKLLEGACV